MNEVNDCDYGIILDQCVKWKSLSLRRFSFKVAHFVLIRGGARKADDDVVCDGWHPIWLIFNLFTSWLLIAVQLVGLEKTQTNLNTCSCYLYKWLVRKSPVHKDGKEEGGNGGDAPPTGTGQKQIVHGHPLSSSLPRLHCRMGRSFICWLQGEIFALQWQR